PLYGGNMYNKVVTTLAKSFAELEIASIRFNYRGVAGSEGSYGAGKGETEDGYAVLHWSQQQFPNNPIWMAGFSFGCYVAAGVAPFERSVQQLVTIAPAVNHFDYNTFTQVHCPWLLIMGDADEIVPVSEVQAWVKNFPVPIKALYLPGASHFFHGRLTE